MKMEKRKRAHPKIFKKFVKTTFFALFFWLLEETFSFFLV